MTRKLVGAAPSGPTDAATLSYLDTHVGGIILVPKTSGQMISPGFNTTTGGTLAYASGAVYGCHIPIPSSLTMDALGVRVVTTQTSTNAKLLLYSCDADGYPVTLVATGTVACTSTGYVFGTTGSVALQAGMYWATLRTDIGTTVRFTCITPTYVSQAGTWSGTTTSQYVPTSDVGTYASPSSTLSSWTPAAAGTTSVPHIVIRLA